MTSDFHTDDLMNTLGNMLKLQPQKRPSAEQIQKDTELNNRQDEGDMMIHSSQAEEFVRLLQDFKDNLPPLGSDFDVEGQIFRWEESIRRKASQEQLLDVSLCLEFLGRVFSEAFKHMTPQEMVPVIRLRAAMANMTMEMHALKGMEEFKEWKAKRLIQLCYSLENETLMDILRLVLNRDCESEEEVDETLWDRTEVQILQECMDKDNSDDATENSSASLSDMIFVTSITSSACVKSSAPG